MMWFQRIGLKSEKLMDADNDDRHRMWAREKENEIC